MASLDTSILVDLLRRRSRFHHRALGKLDELQARGEILATTRFTAAELYVGIELSDNPERDQADVDSLLADLEILDFRGFAARLFAQIRTVHRRRGRVAGDMDTLIAATSLAAGHALLVTRNPSDFSGISDLLVESY
ncbi:MAG: type II toxin-antitoxin system VapC family toxin [Planctomycetes bacterium]|nr:type II toxin-antitoxin system VapC family toxin [Planctomycetota bacterium]MBU4399856.1 type II toxin-antitoxin system VapC family toxin [Planctomycetota bacterium]MCG2683524.1 type II toxin-antitoxin system VapC family toxin [Planctomycetales bacterium]